MSAPSDIAFGAQTTLGFTEDPGNTSGTLTVSDGTHTAAIMLLGQYVAANFNVTSNGVGGTIVTGATVVGGEVQPLLMPSHNN